MGEITGHLDILVVTVSPNTFITLNAIFLSERIGVKTSRIAFSHGRASHDVTPILQ